MDSNSDSFLWWKTILKCPLKTSKTTHNPLLCCPSVCSVCSKHSSFCQIWLNTLFPCQAIGFIKAQPEIPYLAIFWQIWVSATYWTYRWTSEMCYELTTAWVVLLMRKLQTLNNHLLSLQGVSGTQKIDFKWNIVRPMSKYSWDICILYLQSTMLNKTY